MSRAAAIPFCRTAGAKAAYRRWCDRLKRLGVELGEADVFAVALLASREARLEELTRALAACRRDQDLRLRLVTRERLAASDMARALDAAERAFGGMVEEAAVAQGVTVRATGTGRVVPFPAGGDQKPLGVTAQRIVVALAGGEVLTKAELRRRVAGTQGDFLRGLREVLAGGQVRRSGSGSKVSPYKYRR